MLDLSGTASTARVAVRNHVILDDLQAVLDVLRLQLEVQLGGDGPLIAAATLCADTGISRRLPLTGNLG